jgi:exopolyphosphatase/guanosine-5'-triphosphate,3'-diphosphate pyrophosphatase
LGANLKESGMLDPEGVARTLAVVDEYVREIRSQGAVPSVIATSAMRRAADGEAFAAEVERSVGAPLEILSGAREAELSFRGATANVREARELVGVLDVGGGSTEYAYGRLRVAGTISCEIGAVRLSEAIPALLGATVPADVGALEREARAYARERLAPLHEFPKPDDVRAVGGTMFNAASIIAERDRDRIDGVVLTRDALAALARRFLALDAAARRAQPRISAQRADIFPAGLLIADEALDLLRTARCTISQADLLYGYLVERYGA